MPRVMASAWHIFTAFEETGVGFDGLVIQIDNVAHRAVCTVGFVKTYMSVMADTEDREIEIAVILNHAFIAGAFNRQIGGQHIGHKAVFNRQVGMLVKVIFQNQ